MEYQTLEERVQTLEQFGLAAGKLLDFHHKLLVTVASEMTVHDKRLISEFKDLLNSNPNMDAATKRTFEESITSCEKQIASISSLLEAMRLQAFPLLPPLPDPGEQPPGQF
ncbi:MAG TPA: hypothetical protein VGN23_13165 [Verrucomicrobiae bacterium]|jgi:hypothetical protein